MFIQLRITVESSQYALHEFIVRVHCVTNDGKAMVGGDR